MFSQEIFLTATSFHAANAFSLASHKHPGRKCIKACSMHIWIQRKHVSLTLRQTYNRVRKSILLKAEEICLLSITIFHKSDSSSKYLIINNCVHMQVSTQDSLLAQHSLPCFAIKNPRLLGKGF